MELEATLQRWMNFELESRGTEVRFTDLKAEIQAGALRRVTPYIFPAQMFVKTFVGLLTWSFIGFDQCVRYLFARRVIKAQLRAKL